MYQQWKRVLITCPITETHIIYNNLSLQRYEDSYEQAMSTVQLASSRVQGDSLRSAACCPTSILRGSGEHKNHSEEPPAAGQLAQSRCFVWPCSGPTSFSPLSPEEHPLLSSNKKYAFWGKSIPQSQYRPARTTVNGGFDRREIASRARSS